MRRALIIGLVVMAAVMPVSAQDGDFDETEQAALDEARAVLENFIGLNTYSADFSQQTVQDIGMVYLGQTVRLEQTVDAQGIIQFEKTDGAYDNQLSSQSETISQQLSGSGADQTSEIGPVMLDLIVVDDRIYMRLEIESDTTGQIPQGWVDVTDGAEMFPGMGMFDIQQIMELGTIRPEFMTALFDSVVAVDIQEPSEIEGQTVNHYSLELDPVQALESLGDLESMFNSGALPFDVAGLIDLIYSDEDTTFVIDLGIGADDQNLYEMTQVITMDIVIGPDLITDESLKEADITMVQTSTQSYRFYGFDEPVTISAPELAE